MTRQNAKECGNQRAAPRRLLRKVLDGRHANEIRFGLLFTGYARTSALFIAGVILLFMPLTFAAVALAQSQPPSPTGSNLSSPKQSDGGGGEQEPPVNASNSDRNSDRSPIIVKIIQPPQSEEAAKRETQHDKQEARNNRWSLILTGVLGIAALLQFGTFVVMIYRTGKQLRAYVLLEQISIFSHLPMGLNPPPGPIAGAIPQVFIQIKNWGQTPAYEVIQQVVVSIHPIPVYRAPSFTGGMTSKSLIAPGSATNNMIPLDTFAPISAEEWNEITTGNLAIYVFGKISYRDIFTTGIMRIFFKSKVTKYRLMHWRGSPVGSTNMTFCSEGNDAT